MLKGRGKEVKGEGRDEKRTEDLTLNMWQGPNGLLRFAFLCITMSHLTMVSEVLL